MTPDRLEQIWTAQENADAVVEGKLETRYSADAAADVVIGMMVPSGQRFISVGISREHGHFLAPLPQFRVLRTVVHSDPDQTDRISVGIILADPAYTDVFSILAQDIIGSIIDIPTEQAISLALRNRLDKWRTFLEQYRPEGLTRSEQRGLYGEIHFLNHLLSVVKDSLESIQCWTGPQGALQDFQGPSWAIEVKTSSAATHPRVQINGERQLDESGIAHLLLRCILVDERPATRGDTLPALVDSTRVAISSAPTALKTFDENLHAVGYYDHHADLYMQVGYSVRAIRTYRVEEGFPRIRARDVPEGVGSVSYSVSLAACKPFEVSERYITEVL